MPRRVALQEWSIFKGSDCAVIAIVYHLLFHFEVKTRVVLDLLSRSSMPFPCPGITHEDIWVLCAYPLSILLEVVNTGIASGYLPLSGLQVCSLILACIWVELTIYQTDDLRLNFFGRPQFHCITEIPGAAKF